MASSESTLAFEMHDVLAARCAAEMHPGGKLAGLTSLHKSAQFTAKDGPGAGIALRGWDPPEPYGPRRRKVRVRFEIILAARSVKTTTKAPNLDDAVQALRPLIDDGSGAGFVGILNDPHTFALPSAGQSLASESELGVTEFVDQIADGPEAAVWCYCTIAYSAVGFYNF